MPAISRSRLTALAIVAALAGGLTACASDDAVKSDAKDAQQDIDRGAGDADEKAKGAAEDAGEAIKKGAEDVDGQ